MVRNLHNGGIMFEFLQPQQGTQICSLRSPAAPVVAPFSMIVMGRKIIITYKL